MRRGTTDPEANRLLAALPEREYRRLARVLVAVPLAAHAVLYEPGQVIEHVYFPMRGTLVALLGVLADGRSFAAGLVGDEGVAGVEVFLGGAVAHFRALVLAGGGALRMDAGAFRAEVRDSGPLAGLLRRYAHFLLVHVSQVAGCNCFHPLEQHFCSLLLRLQDRTGGTELAVTHELFARLVGVRRVGITQVARKLQRAGLIRYRWGKVTLLDRAGLEARACVCHRQIERACRHLLGTPAPRR
jgi:CRP-like cAMP-binding protein